MKLLSQSFTISIKSLNLKHIGCFNSSVNGCCLLKIKIEKATGLLYRIEWRNIFDGEKGVGYNKFSF